MANYDKVERKRETHQRTKMVIKLPSDCMGDIDTSILCGAYV